MRKKPITSTLTLVLIFLISGIVFLISCGESDTQTDDTDTVDAGEKPQATTREDTTKQPDQAEEVFEASLEGANQVPEVETDANGFFTVVLREDSIHVSGEFADLRGEYVASHIHMGAEDENGDPIQPLDPELGEENRSGTWDGAYSVDEDFISALKGDSLYVNVHSEEHQKGEIRGQLIKRDAEKEINSNQ